MAGSCFIIYIHKLLNFAIYGFKAVAVTLQIFILRQNTIEIAVAMLLWRPQIVMWNHNAVFTTNTNIF
jgi:hypothetical protein